MLSSICHADGKLQAVALCFVSTLKTSRSASVSVQRMQHCKTDGRRSDAPGS